MYDSSKHFAATYTAFSSEFSFGARSQTELEEWQAAFRPRLRQILGLDNLAADLVRHQPSAELWATEDMGDCIRESWHIWVEPTVPLLFIYCVHS